MSLILVFHNDQPKNTGPLKNDANYNVTVMVGDGGPNSTILAEGRVEGHQRSNGWRVLVRRFLVEIR